MDGIAPLPEPRSSHELVAHEDKLYVIGGWKMEGGKGVEWHHHAARGRPFEETTGMEKLQETQCHP